MAFLTGYSKKGGRGNSRFKLHFLAPPQLQNRRIILALLRFADGLMLTTDTILEQKRLMQTEEEQSGRSAAQSKSKVTRSELSPLHVAQRRQNITEHTPVRPVSVSTVRLIKTSALFLVLQIKKFPPPGHNTQPPSSSREKLGYYLKMFPPDF